MTTVVPERRAKSAACNLVNMPPVPRPVAVPPAACHNSGGMSGSETLGTSWAVGSCVGLAV